eukprot:g14291.t1
MKVVGFLLAIFATPDAHLAFAQATDGGGLQSAGRDALKLTQFAVENVTDAGLYEVHPIGAEEKEVAQDLVYSLEGGGETTVVGEVKLGKLLCESLDGAPGATLLRFTISSTETVIAERTSYSTVDGSVLPDGEGRKLWMGKVVVPEPPAGSVPRTVSMVWTGPCDVETFLLKVVSHKKDGSTSVIKSVPCSAGSSNELCMVELDVVFKPNSDATIHEPLDLVTSSEDNIDGVETLPPMDVDLVRLKAQDSQRAPNHRRLQGTTEIDVLVLYSTETFAYDEEAQWVTNIVAGFSTVNEATTNSGIDLRFNLVSVEQLPYDQATSDTSTELQAVATNLDVQALRDELQADLVLLVGNFPGTCGRGYIFQAGRDDLGYSLMDDDCFDNFTHSHEMGHNLGCDHDRDNSSGGVNTDYGHGWRYCEGDVQYRTIMSYADGGCEGVPSINYFSNPDIDYLGIPTGTPTDDNARIIEDNMVAVSNFRTGALNCADIDETCTTAGDCCSDFCGSAGICANEICGGAGGDLETIGDSLCNPENNNAGCDYDGGDCCECDCVEKACGIEESACTTPAWSCVDSPEQTEPLVWLYGVNFCPSFSFASDLGNCDYYGGATCDCTCSEGGDALCSTGTGYDCIDPDSSCAFEICGAAGGLRDKVGNGICEAENNVEDCEYDGGDCCSCDCVEPQPQCGTGNNACTEPVWSCIDSPEQTGQGIYTFGSGCSAIHSSDLGECDYFGGETCDCTCVEGGGSLCGSGTGFDCEDPTSTCGPTPCATSADCTVDGEECCPVKLVCEVPDTTDPLACGDPHMTGFRGQTFDFTGEDGEWYCLISDLPSMHLNMRVTAPVPSLPKITYITGLSIVTTDVEGSDHSIVIEVSKPHSLESACPAGVNPCLADGALNVSIDGSEVLLRPGTVSVAPGVTVSAVNLPGACRSFGFEKYWEQKKLEYAQATGRRRLAVEQSMGEWVIGDPTATNMEECIEYVVRATAVSDAGMFEHQSEHASFQIVMPTATIRLSHGRLHQLPMRDPTDRFDLPEHTTWQMNMAINHNDVSREATGVLGETLTPTLDDNGMPIMQGMGAIRGSEKDYRVEAALGVKFNQSKNV